MLERDAISRRRRMLVLASLFVSACGGGALVRTDDPSPGPGPLKDIPRFPTPVPRPSSHATLSLKSAGIAKTAAQGLTHGQIDTALLPIFKGAAYTQRRYFAFPGGYAMLTQFERIGDNGKPAADRWGLEKPNDFDGTFLGYLGAMLKGACNRSRFMAFVVTDQPVMTANGTPTFSELKSKFNDGVLDVLPGVLALRAATSETQLHVLIYEFELPVGATEASAGRLVESPSLSARAHLQAASLLPPLELA